MTERKRQWEAREALKAINHKLAFVTSDNPAAAVRFPEENFCAKRHDATTIKKNIDDLSKLKVKIDELNAKGTKDDNALFDSNGRYIRSGHKFSHDINAREEFLEFEINQKDCWRNHGAVGEGSRQSGVHFLILKQGNAPKRKSQMRQQNRHKSEKRIRLRYTENEEAIQRKILQIQEDTELTLDKDFVIDHDITDAIATLKVHEMCYLSSISNNIPSTTQAVQTIRASLSKPCFRKLVWIDASVPCETNPWR